MLRLFQTIHSKMRRKYRGKQARLLCEISNSGVNGTKCRAFIMQTRKPRKVLAMGPYRDDQEKALAALCACLEPLPAANKRE